MSDQANPTFLCHAWAAFKLLQEGNSKAAEQELANAFGFTIREIYHEGRWLGKLTLNDRVSPEQITLAMDQLRADMQDRIKPK